MQLTAAEYRQRHTATAPAPAKGTPAPTAPVASLQGRDTAKEVAGPKANATVRYAFAGPLHAEQFPGEFRCTITGPLPMKPELIAALLELARLAKEQFIDPAP